MTTVRYGYFRLDSRACASLTARFHIADGEPYGHAWPHVGSSYGSFDLAGFPKAAVWFYRSLWYSGIAADAPDRPALPFADTVRIVQDNERDSRAPDRESSDGLSNIIQVYSSCPTVELFVNGVSKGKQVRPRHGLSPPCQISTC